MRLAAALLLTMVWGGMPSSALGLPLTANFALELEYLGENYFSEIDLVSPELDNSDLLPTEVTKFSDDQWLPGSRLEFRWFARNATRQSELASRTFLSSDRVTQSLDGLLKFVGEDRHVWTFRGEIDIREEESSLVGHGDWGTRLQAGRSLPVSSTVTFESDVSWMRSRTRGDTTSFIYDYDRLRWRLGLVGEGEWLPKWDAYLNFTTKDSQDEDEGSYFEIDGTGYWLASESRNLRLRTGARVRNYKTGGEIGRDFFQFDIDVDSELWQSGDAEIGMELELESTDYQGSDELYYDFGLASLYPFLKHRGLVWDFRVGPRLRRLLDWQKTGRDYWQGTLRGDIGRTFGTAGFGELSLEFGRREYQNDSESLELTDLNTTLLRSDYWLINALLLVNVSLGQAYSLDLLADTLLELHATDSERVQVTLASLSISRAF